MCSLWIKTSTRAWFERLSIFLLGLGLVSNKADSSLFVLYSPISMLLILIHHSNINFTSSNSFQVTQLISQLGKEFPLNDLGKLRYFLGSEAIHTSERLFLTQSRNATYILIRTSLTSCKPVSLPLCTTHNFHTSASKMLSPSTMTSY